MRLSVVPFVLALLLLATPALAEEADLGAQIDAIFADYTAEGSPGAAVAVIQDDEVVFSRGYGLANLELEVPITPTSVFYLGSVSKQFVAAAIALLEQESKLGLDDDIRKYVPELPDYGTPITVRHLVHHTSGIRDYLELAGLAGVDIGTYHDDDEVVAMLARQKALNFEPGTEYLYSNSGYLLLAVIVEKASGKSLREYAEEKIFGPLGMENTHFHDNYMHLIPHRASGYFPDGEDGYLHFLTTFDRVGSGGVYSNVTDLALWDRNFYDGKVGGQALLDRMHEQGRLADGEQLDYAFGLNVSEDRGLRVVRHGGALGGYRSTMTRYPDERLSVVVLANVSSAQPGFLADQVVELFLADRFEQTEDGGDGDAEDAFEAVEVSAKALERIAGDYWNGESGYSRRIYVNDEGTAMYWRNENSETPLAPVGDDKFRMIGVGAKVDVAFEAFKKGKATRMVVRINDGPPILAEAFEPVEVTDDYLGAYTGNYYSEELDTDLELFVEDGALVARDSVGDETPLNAELQDIFAVDGAVVEFQRKKKGPATAFTLSTGRVKGIVYQRK